MDPKVEVQASVGTKANETDKFKRMVFVGIICFIFGNILAGSFVYLTLKNTFLTKQTNLENQINLLKNETLTTKTKTNINQIPHFPTQTENTVTRNTIDNWKIFESKEVGIRFSHPPEFGEFEISIQDGDTGKIFQGSFQNGKYFFIGGITPDYTAPREGEFITFYQYIFNEGKYYHLAALDKKWPIEPVKVITTDKLGILILNEDSYIEERGIEDGPKVNPGENGGALINLPGSDRAFKGVAVLNLDNKVLKQNEFENILKTIEAIN